MRIAEEDLEAKRESDTYSNHTHSGRAKILDSKSSFFFFFLFTTAQLPTC